ncbi:GntR family transcriptional regulator [Sarcina ventriculi]|uniref:GntR family transcriptional regulator n=1 Tax=Sarcina ventriculi TaxID=1267 RepID=UPI0018AC56EE|nr:GntR family transcriptional regulator [Sarcina ventriculi]
MILYEKLNKETSKEYAYRVLKDNIMSLELKPGDLLSETELSKVLNLSRTPIREVIMKLKSEYLIEVKPQSGTYVAKIDWNLIDEAIFMRYFLEKEVLKEACINFNENNLIDMEKCLFAQQLIADKENNELEFHHLDNEFHRLLFEGVNKKNIWEAIGKISTHYNRMRLLNEISQDKNKIISEHTKYLTTIKNKDINSVNNIVLEHIKKSADSCKKKIQYEEGGLFFK